MLKVKACCDVTSVLLPGTMRWVNGARDHQGERISRERERERGGWRERRISRETGRERGCGREMVRYTLSPCVLLCSPMSSMSTCVPLCPPVFPYVFCVLLCSPMSACVLLVYLVFSFVLLCSSGFYVLPCIKAF